MTVDIDELAEQVGQALEATVLARAAQLLDRVSGEDVAEEDQPALVGLWEELADAFAERGRHDNAVATIERCLELEYAADHDVRGTLAVHLLRSGNEDDADALWEVVATEQPEEVTLRFMAGVAYQDLGEHEEALGWFDEALEMVLAHGDHEGWLADLLQARDESLSETAQQSDDLQKRGDAMLAQQLRHLRTLDPLAQRRTQDAGSAVGWFPRSEWESAAALWPALPDGFADYQEYARDVQRRLLEADQDGRAVLSPLYVDAFTEWCDANDLTASETAAADDYATEVARVGNAVPWPPRGREACWCGSGEKYKKCCGTVTL